MNSVASRLTDNQQIPLLTTRRSVASDIGSWEGDESRTLASVETSIMNLNRSNNEQELAELRAATSNSSIAPVLHDLSELPVVENTPVSGSKNQENTTGKVEINVKQSDTQIMSTANQTGQESGTASQLDLNKNGRDSVEANEDQHGAKQNDHNRTSREHEMNASKQLNFGSSYVTLPNNFTEIDSVAVDGSDADCFSEECENEASASLCVDSSNTMEKQEFDGEIKSPKLPDHVDALDQSLMMSSLVSSSESNDDGLVYITAGEIHYC